MKVGSVFSETTYRLFNKLISCLERHANSERVAEWLRRLTRKPKVSEPPRFKSHAGQFGHCP